VTASDVHTRLDVERIRADFPILAREINGRPIAYLDSANMRSLLNGDQAFYELARAAVDERLRAVATA